MHPVSRRQGVALTRRGRGKGLADGSNPRKTAATPMQAIAEAYSTGLERRRAAKSSKTMARAALPMRRDSTQGMLVACVRAAACNLVPPGSRGEPRNTRRTFGRDPAWPCSREPTRGKDPTRALDLKFGAVQRKIKEAPSAGKVCSAGRTFLVAW